MKDYILIRSGQAITTDLLIAKAFGKRASDLKRIIRSLPCPDDFRERNFTQTTYVDQQGKKQPMYEITKDGFVLLVMGFTGKKAIDFKIQYIEAFNSMENYLNIRFDQFNEICQRYETSKDSVSHSARCMAFWKNDKPILLSKINHLKRVLQLDLFNKNNGDD